MQSLVKPGHIMPRFPRRSPVSSAGLGIGLQPLGFAKARLEGEVVLLLTQAQALCQQAACGVALIAVGVAQGVQVRSGTP